LRRNRGPAGICDSKYWKVDMKSSSFVWPDDWMIGAGSRTATISSRIAIPQIFAAVRLFLMFRRAIGLMKFTSPKRPKPNARYRTPTPSRCKMRAVFKLQNQLI